MRIIVRLVAMLALPAQLLATVVTGTVKDPNGIAYANGTIQPTLVNLAGGQPYITATGATVQSVGVAQLDATGSFSLSLQDNTTITPGGTQWRFKVCSGAGSLGPAIGAGSVCFTAADITISGASQSITTQLNAAAVALSFLNSVTTLNLPAGAAFLWNGDAGFFRSSAGTLNVGTNGVINGVLNANSLNAQVSLQVGQPTANLQFFGGATFDAGISRSSANQVAFGNGTVGDASGQVKANLFINNNNNSRLGDGGVIIANTHGVGFSSTALSDGFIDTAITRGASGGVVDFGNGVLGDTSGTVALTTIQIQSTTFASLGTPANGTLKFCSDCTIANPCAGGGTGALAKRLNAVWVCN